ncbi:MAG: adenylate/guanylate cyclase domain-containing protein [Actinobacteria bacterium]|nr:adenylate/guanylate cyclase domain-containing protein [Actinomycetota bacterium]
MTIAFTDIENSTVLTDRLGDREWVAVLETHDELVRRLVERRGGFVVKHLGDGFMLAFASAISALRALREIHAGVDDVRVEGAPLRVRAGAHISARPSASATTSTARPWCWPRASPARRQADRRWSTSLVRDLVESAAEFDFRDLGELELKGLSRPVRVFELTG